MKQLKPFMRTLQRMTGANPMQRRLSLRGCHSQTDADDTEVRAEQSPRVRERARVL